LSGLNADLPIDAADMGHNAMKKRSSYSIAVIIFASLFSALFLTPACLAQGDFQLKNAAVTPDYGYEDFTYTVQVWMSDQIAGRVGELKVTTFNMQLNIYDKGTQIYSESSPSKRGLDQTSFSFGPYSFKNKFGIESTTNASFEFIFYKDGQEAARTARIKGPTVKPPALTGTNFYKTPYFFQGISMTAGFNDMENLKPAPTCHLEITGPLGTPEARSWNTEDVACEPSGKSSYTCTINEDLSTYRDGGNFSFNLVYSNLKLDPMKWGPYNITLRPYNPSVDMLKIQGQIDYSNFSIKGYITDEGVKMMGGSPTGSVANLMISHPRKGKMTYSSSEPTLQGRYLVFIWTNENIPLLFNKSDVKLSLDVPFQAALEYRNENWNYSAVKSNVSFKVVEEIPVLDLQCPSIVYVPSGETTPLDIIATVTFKKGSGDMNLRLSGPNKDLNVTQQATPLGGNRYQYKWTVPFDDSHVDNNYTLSLSFINPMMEGGRLAFEDKIIHVSPVRIQFLEAEVAPIGGQWNDSFNYSLKMDSTVVPLQVHLQTYDPCSREWLDKGAKSVQDRSSRLYWQLKPFRYECKEMGQQSAKYRFKASFAQEDYVSQAYDGPSFQSANPTLVSPLVYEPRVYVPEDGSASSSVQAIVQYAPGQGVAVLNLTGPDGISREFASYGAVLGNNSYQYDWSLPFDGADIGKNFTISLSYRHSSLAKDYFLENKTISVRLVSILFGKANVMPSKGRWNDTYVFSVHVDSNVETDVKLEVYSPCSHEWVQRTTAKAAAGPSTINLTATPFRSRCADAEGENASYRFVASFDGESLKSDEYIGPFINRSDEGAKPPKALKSNVSASLSGIAGIVEPTLNLKYDPIVDIPSVPDGTALQHFNATVIFPYTNGTLRLNVSGTNMQFEERLKPVNVYGNRSIFERDVQFNSSHAGKTYEISVIYINPALPGGEHSFIPYSMRVRQESNNATSNPSLSAPEVIGTVSPRRGVLQAWQESDKLYAFTYTAQLKNLSSGSAPWVELLVKAQGRSWKAAGEKQQYDPAQGNITWTLKPFFDREFLGTAEFKFLVDGVESKVFKGPEIVAIYKGLSFEKSTKADTYNYFGKFNASINLTIDLLSSEDNIQWKNIGKPQRYSAGSGEVLRTWKDQPVIRYYEFDIRTASGEVIS
jgi:hypothetical protein